jgi:glutamate-1-semialdehyde 2,1-aminomutase
MFAIRAARAFTGRDLIARFDGAYHGTHDTVLPHSPGVPEATSGLVVDLPWGDPDGIEQALAGRERQLAAIIIEPVQGAGGVRPADPAFLRSLREMTREIGAVLIFDEIIAFRVGPNGAQGMFGVRPDLTTLGKIVGGGYALAAFGGRAEIMDRFDARRPGAMSHGGTFNGNPVAAAAGLATLRALTPDRYDRLAELGGRLRSRLADSIAAGGIDARVEGIASLFQVFAGPTLQGEDGLTASQTLFLGLLVGGFHVAPRGMGAISTPVTERDVDELSDAIVARLAAMSAAPSRIPAATR